MVTWRTWHGNEGNINRDRYLVTVVNEFLIINHLNAELNPIHHLLALVGARHIFHVSRIRVNTLKAELNPIHHLLALVGARHIVHVSRIRVNTLNAELNPIRHLLALVGARHFVNVSWIMVKRGKVYGPFGRVQQQCVLISICLLQGQDKFY